MLKDFLEGYWDDVVKVVGIFGALPGSKEPIQNFVYET